MNKFKKIFLLDVGITNAKIEEILEFIYIGLEKPQKKYYIVTPNPELIMFAQSNTEYKTILNNAEIALPDGIGVVWGARVLGKPIKQRITGIDFMESLCKYASKRPITVSLLGGGPNIANKTSDCLRKKYPGLKVAFAISEVSQVSKVPQVSRGERSKTTFDTHATLPSCDILFVAFGSPKQEIWISENFQNLQAKVVIGVGGSFDFISGKVMRAPEFLQNLGLEWLFRLIRQPWRIKRQVNVLRFIYLIFREKLK